MPKLSVYVETSVWSYAFADDAPESRDITLRFFDDARKGKHDLFISPIVLTEIGRANERVETRLRGLIAELAPVMLDFDDEMDHLAQDFLNNGVVPPAKIEDAQHVAVAVASELDILVSWNYRHLVNVRRREKFHHVSVMNGYYKPLQIVTPPEVDNESQ